MKILSFEKNTWFIKKKRVNPIEKAFGRKKVRPTMVPFIRKSFALCSALNVAKSKGSPPHFIGKGRTHSSKTIQLKPYLIQLVLNPVQKTNIVATYLINFNTKNCCVQLVCL